jgi:curved DNA-binding protein CbpA
MDKDSIDLRYAYAQLGIPDGSSLEEIQEVLTNATDYRFHTRERVESVRLLAEFFIAREKLGGVTLSFEELKKKYRQQAMALHPDRNLGNKVSEDQLKEINTAYARVEVVHKQARDYYRQSESFRRDVERHAREKTSRERPNEKKESVDEKGMPRKEKARPSYKSARPTKNPPKKYMAAYVPRSIRTARLGYLPLHTIIGSKALKKENDISFVFDYFMLPEDQFLRAKSYLSSPEVVLPALQYGKFAPPYTLKDIKEVFVPEDEPDPEEYAKNYFRTEFALSF